MKYGVVTFPGSNCDHDMIYALRDLLGQEVVNLWHKDTDLQSCDFIILPGGFSYGDYLRSGSIARFSPIMDEVIKHANNGGYLLGICNGFQVLCEAQLLPGALLHNDNQKFICKNIYLKTDNNNSILTSKADLDKALKIPVSHGEGRYYASDEIVERLKENEQVLYYYCNENGEITEEGNPNGSVSNIAAICNKTKNVFGMMPHPERAADPELGNTDGRVILESMLEAKELV